MVILNLVKPIMKINPHSTYLSSVYHIYTYVYSSGCHPSIFSFIHLCIHLFSNEPSINPSVHLCIHTSCTHASMYACVLPFHQCAYSSINPSTHLSRYVCMCPSINVPVLPCIHPCIYAPIHPPCLYPCSHPSTYSFTPHLHPSSYPSALIFCDQIHWMITLSLTLIHTLTDISFWSP